MTARVLKDDGSTYIAREERMEPISILSLSKDSTSLSPLIITLILLATKGLPESNTLALIKIQEFLPTGNFKHWLDYYANLAKLD